MRPTLALLLALLCAPLVTHAQPTPKPATVRDHLWMFGVPPGSDQGYFEGGGIRGGSRMTPVEACFWMGVPNLLFVTQAGNPPDMYMEKRGNWKTKTTKEQHAIAFQPLQRVRWAAVGSGGVGGAVQDIISLTKNYPNIQGIYLDDFVQKVKTRTDQRRVGSPAMSAEALKEMEDALAKVGRPMEVWATIYTREFNRDMPNFIDCEPPLVESMKHFDVLVMWTWNASQLIELEKNLTLLESIKPKRCRIALGLYLWDYDGKATPKPGDVKPPTNTGAPVPIDLMEHQCSLGLKWLKEGRVSDLVILGNTSLDVGIPSASWMRDWVKKHGDERITR